MLLLLFSGCAAAPATDAYEPAPSRPLVAGPIDTTMTKFRLDLQSTPVATPLTKQAQQRTLRLGGNSSEIELMTIFFMNALNPAHSNAVPTVTAGQDEPRIVGRWANGDAFLTHKMAGSTVTLAVTAPGGYVEQSRSTTSVVAPEALDATFTAEGWGDIYAEVIVRILASGQAAGAPDEPRG